MGSAQQPPQPAAVWSDAADAFRRWRTGEAAGLDDLVRCLSPVLWHVVRAHGLDAERSQDVVQGTWLTFVRRADTIEEPQAVAAWLTTTARREAWRVAKSDTRTLAVGDEMLASELPPDVSAESVAITEDERTRLWRCVQNLSERCQRLMRIVAFDDRPDYRRLAEDMQMPVGSIGPTRGRCLDKLRALLADENQEMAAHD